MRNTTILLADDDPDECLLTEEALKEDGEGVLLRCVQNGEELLDYLRYQGRYTDPASAPRPHLILLDLDMPLKDGREVLQEIKSDPALRRIPIVVMTNSTAEEDLLNTYNLGVNSFIPKPMSFNQMLEVIHTLGKYWFGVVKLPPMND
ncbi:MAG TPA: response regulator [Candidatus Caenarcaniphilales bacterium]